MKGFCSPGLPASAGLNTLTSASGSLTGALWKGECRGIIDPSIQVYTAIEGTSRLFQHWNCCQDLWDVDNFR